MIHTSFTAFATVASIADAHAGDFVTSVAIAAHAGERTSQAVGTSRAS